MSRKSRAKSSYASDAIPPITKPTVNEKLCPWCASLDGDPIENHSDWCERKIMARIIARGADKLGKNRRRALEDKVQELKSVIGEYETTLRLIAAPKRSDGTYNRDREACRALAEGILRVHCFNYSS